MPVRVASSRTKSFSPNDPADEGGLGYPVPEGEEKTIYVVRKADGNAFIARQDIFSKVSYITKDETGEVRTERDFPMGQLMIETLMLVFDSWNLTPRKDSKPYPITHDNIRTLMEPEEIKWLYEHIIDMNPCWGGKGE